MHKASGLEQGRLRARPRVAAPGRHAHDREVQRQTQPLEALPCLPASVLARPSCAVASAPLRLPVLPCFLLLACHLYTYSIVLLSVPAYNDDRFHRTCSTGDHLVTRLPLYGLMDLFKPQEKARELLAGTSTLSYEHDEPHLDPPANVKHIFTELIVPVFEKRPEYKAPTDQEELWQLFAWATGAVASYSFELGDEGLHVRFRTGFVETCLQSATAFHVRGHCFCSCCDNTAVAIVPARCH